jgi:uncharacterized protein with LGFP repeats
LLLGHPAGAERDIVGGQVRTYARGRIYWSGATGAHEIHGVILAAYRARPRQRACLGFPATDVTRIPGGVRSRFAHGTITHWRAAGRTSISCAGAGR